MILILCGIMLAQTSVGGTFVHDAPYAGPSVKSEILHPAKSDTASVQVQSMLRVAYEPGGSIVAHVVSASTTYHITSGVLECEVLSGGARVVRALTGNQSSNLEEMISAGQVVTLNAGDTVYYERGTVQTERNDGDTPTVVLVTIDHGGAR
jgi:quercetin dioxygenase-like cupin family protein